MDTKIKNAEDLGRVVREARKAQKLSQGDLAGMDGAGRARYPLCPVDIVEILK